MRQLNCKKLDLAPASHVIFCDVDLTLLPSMSRVVTAEQRQLISSLFINLAGGFVFITGRSLDGVDQCFPGMPASVEHHAAYRDPRMSQRGFTSGELKEHVSPLDTVSMDRHFREALGHHLPIFTSTDQVSGADRGTFIESKKYSMALVHSPVLGQKDKGLLVDAAKEVWETHNLTETHRVAVGFDAVEISVQGKDKGIAIRDYMKNEFFHDRTPIMIGDSMSDAKAMQVCHEEYNGIGIAVGDAIPDAPYVHFRCDDIADVWNTLKDFNAQPALQVGHELFAGPDYLNNSALGAASNRALLRTWDLTRPIANGIKPKIA